MLRMFLVLHIFKTLKELQAKNLHLHCLVIYSKNRYYLETNTILSATQSAILFSYYCLLLTRAHVAQGRGLHDPEKHLGVNKN